jgi:hypothetical protein
MIREERFALTAALQSGDAQRIAHAKAEALRVCGMYEVDPAHVRLPERTVGD